MKPLEVGQSRGELHTQASDAADSVSLLLHFANIAESLTSVYPRAAPNRKHLTKCGVAILRIFVPLFVMVPRLVCERDSIFDALWRVLKVGDIASRRGVRTVNQSCLLLYTTLQYTAMARMREGSSARN